MLEQSFGRSLLQVDKQADCLRYKDFALKFHLLLFYWHWINYVVQRTVCQPEEGFGPKRCSSIKLQNLYCAFPLEFYGLDKFENYGFFFAQYYIITYILQLDLRSLHIKQSICILKLQKLCLKGLFIGANTNLPPMRCSVPSRFGVFFLEKNSSYVF